MPLPRTQPPRTAVSDLSPAWQYAATPGQPAWVLDALAVNSQGWRWWDGRQWTSHYRTTAPTHADILTGQVPTLSAPSRGSSDEVVAAWIPVINGVQTGVTATASLSAAAQAVFLIFFGCIFTLPVALTVYTTPGSLLKFPAAFIALLSPAVGLTISGIGVFQLTRVWRTRRTRGRS